MSSLGISSFLKGLKQSDERRKEIYRAVKTGIVLVIIISLVGVMFSGCNNQLLSKGGINAPLIIKYTVENPLTIEECTEDGGYGFEYSYVKVSGLADKEAEQRINDRIKAVYDELRAQDISPYRGIKARIPEGSAVQSEMILTYVAGNFNNILSIVFDKYATYGDSLKNTEEKDKKYYDNSVNFSEMETLNFDLNTGEEISLRDLFCDNVDYMELINDNMSKFLAKNNSEEEDYYIGTEVGNLKLVESFKGLSEDQMFAVYPQGISFVFDYRTPQFDTSCMASSMMIEYTEFGDTIAATRRFYDEKTDIYTSDEPPVKAFAIKNVQSDITGHESIDEDPVNIYLTWSYSSKLPKETKNKLEEMSEVDREKVDELKEICSKYSPATEDNTGGWCSYEIMVYGERVGPFINISKNSYIYLSDSGSQESEYHCYHSDTLKELKLGDIFKNDYDYKRIVTEAIRKELKTNVEKDGEQISMDLTDRQVQEAFDSIGGFNLAVDAVVIPVSNPGESGFSYQLPLSIPYKDFGCENLNIFD